MEILKESEMIHSYENSVECFKTSNYETPVWFDMAGNFTIDQTDERTIYIRETGNEKNRFIVILTYGIKFPPIYIFKGKKLSHNEQNLTPSGVIVWFQPNGWMDSNLMMDYVNYINKSRTNSESKSPMMIVYDFFKGYLEESVKKNFMRMYLWVTNNDAREISADKVIIQSFKTCKISNSLNELIKYKFEMESNKENEKELEIDMHDSQAR
ncbi:pogo transposable element with KRAB domain [Rhizophagus clarus]|uniref:Pogo transposable element with KRAB domain n=1 Tax=Rhizophagus clarus TaxID=94130 RepID=A0A8H3QGH6_9GLOM|nr:pogo transposable element with KRAB domain [Rhizophagus clarus]